MASSQPHGSSLQQDLAKIRWNDIIIKDYKKTVKLLEQKPPTSQRIQLIHTYKYHILQLETENKDLRDKLDRC